MSDRSTITCEQALDRIDAAVRGRLPDEEAARLAAHVAGCPTCRAAEADARVVRRALAGVAPARCPDHLVARILETTDAMQAAPRAGALDRVAAWLAGALWRPVAATAVAVLVIVAVTGRPTPPAHVGTTPAASAGDASFCDEDIDALLASVNLEGIDEAAARRAAEEACLAFGIFARAVNRAAGAAESGLMQSLEVPLKKGVESGIERLPAPFQRPEREALDRRG